MGNKIIVYGFNGVGKSTLCIDGLSRENDMDRGTLPGDRIYGKTVGIPITHPNTLLDIPHADTSE